MNTIQAINHFVKIVKTTVGCVLLLVVAGNSFAQSSVNLESIVFSQLAGDDIQISLMTDGEATRVGNFSTDDPARVVFDFFGVKKQLSESRIDINAGKVVNVVAVETDDRTRVIISLLKAARYELLESEDGYAIMVYNTQSDNTARRQPQPFAKRTDIRSDLSVENIDFRRSEAGGGSLTIDFNTDTITVDTRTRDGEIVLDILNTHLPNELERRLDVIDFATPVRTIDAFQNADNVRLVLVPQGKFQYLSFQTGNRFTLVVDPIIESKEDVRDRNDARLGYQGERLSINFKKIDVRSALAVLADFTGVNFVTSDSVQGEITINLKDVPWDQALDVIMKVKGLSKRQTGNVIWVAPSKEIAKAEEEDLKSQTVHQEFAPLVIEIIQINYAKATDIANVIKSVSSSTRREEASRVSEFLGSRNFVSDSQVTSRGRESLLTERGSVTVDERTNSLLVQDVAVKIQELREVVSQLDRPVRQVLIETRIVEANDTFVRELGARLGFQRITDNAQFPGISNSNIGEFVGSGTTEGLTTIQNSQIDDEPGLIFDTSRGAPGGLAVDLGAEGIGNSLPAFVCVRCV